MKQLLKDIIIDQKNFLVNRRTILRKFPEKYLKNDEIIIISGVRRCGNLYCCNKYVNVFLNEIIFSILMMIAWEILQWSTFNSYMKSLLNFMEKRIIFL